VREAMRNATSGFVLRISPSSTLRHVREIDFQVGYATASLRTLASTNESIMPGIFHTPMSRKRFFGTSTAIVGGLLAANRRVLADDAPGTAHLALLSDTHIPADATNEYRGFRPVDNLQKVVPQVVASKPQAAILNGDAARLTGEHEDYVALKSLLQPIASSAPIHIGLGNHDDRKNFFQVFKQKEDDEALVNGKHVSIFELAGTRFVVLDSLLYVEGDGITTELDWT